MSQSNKNTENLKESLVVKLLSILFIIFAIICLILAFASKQYKLLLSTLGFILLIITMNIANRFEVNKHNSKIISIICAILELASIPLIFVYVIYSYVLLAPSIILSKKMVKYDSRNKLGLLLFILSIIMVIICIISSFITKF